MTVMAVYVRERPADAKLSAALLCKRVEREL
jgi:hypothetical protein